MDLSLFANDGNLGDGGVSGGIGGVRGGGVSGGIGSSGIGSGGGVSGGIGATIQVREVTIKVSGTFFTGIGLALPAYGIYQNLGAAGNIRQILENKGWSINSVDEGTGTGVHRTFTISANVREEYDDATVNQNIRSHLGTIMTVTNAAIVRKSNPSYVSNVSNNMFTPGEAVPLSGMLNSLGMGLGLSTPVVIAGAALLLILVLKR